MIHVWIVEGPHGTAYINGGDAEALVNIGILSEGPVQNIDSITVHRLVRRFA